MKVIFVAILALGLLVPMTAAAQTCKRPKKLFKGKCLYPDEIADLKRRKSGPKPIVNKHGGKVLHHAKFKSKSNSKKLGWKLGRLSKFCHTLFKGKGRYWIEAVGKSGCIQTYSPVTSHPGDLLVSADIKLVHSMSSKEYTGILIGNPWTERDGKRRNFIEFLFNKDNQFVLSQWRYGKGVTHHRGRFKRAPGKKGKIVKLKLQYYRGQVLGWINGFLVARAQTSLPWKKQVGVNATHFGMQIELKRIMIRRTAQ